MLPLWIALTVFTISAVRPSIVRNAESYLLWEVLEEE